MVLVWRMNVSILGMKGLTSCYLDKTPNSYNQPATKSMVLVWRMNVSILGMKELTSLSRLILYLETGKSKHIERIKE